MKISFFIASIVICAPLCALATDLSKPYPEYTATVVRVIDGDTIEVEVDLWPGLVAQYSIRERGIDAPELRKADCEAEELWAQEARDQLASLYPTGTIVRLDNVERDSFFGRVVADVRRLLPSQQWRTLQFDMVSRGLAVEWEPNQADVSWCLLAQTR